MGEHESVWIVGVILFGTLVAAASLLLDRGVATTERKSPWDIAQVSHRYIFIVGSLSGFSVASATFLAGFIERTGSVEMLTVIGMFLTAFLVSVGTAMMFATVPPNPASAQDESANQWQRAIFMVAICGIYSGFVLASFALRPLMLSIDLDVLADIYTWVLLLGGLAGVTRMGMFLYALTGHRGRTCLALPVLAFGGAAVYGFVLVPVFPRMWPDQHAPLLLSIAIFVIVSGGFVMESIALAFGPRHRLCRWIVDRKSPALLAYIQLLTFCVGLLWTSISGLM